MCMDCSLWVPRDHRSILWTLVMEIYLSVEQKAGCPAGCEVLVPALDTHDVETHYLRCCPPKVYSQLTNSSPVTGCEEIGDAPVTLEII